MSVRKYVKKPQPHKSVRVLEQLLRARYGEQWWRRSVVELCPVFVCAMRDPELHIASSTLPGLMAFAVCLSGDHAQCETGTCQSALDAQLVTCQSGDHTNCFSTFCEVVRDAQTQFFSGSLKCLDCCSRASHFFGGRGGWCLACYNKLGEGA
jgi:hypothetical protein